MWVFADPARVRRDPRLQPRALLVASLLCAGLMLGTWADVQASSVITHGPRDQRWVALTFDDGWSADRCESIVSTLRKRKATATFFINGMIIAGAPARWRRMLDGFPVANHTRHHPFLTRLDSSAIRTEIASNEKVIEKALGRPMLRLLRPPYGAYDQRVVSIADSLGYRTILWDISSGDTSAGATTSSVIRNATRGGKGAIVLLHCGPAVTPGAVGAIISSYRARGFEFVDLGQMLGLTPVQPVTPPDVCRVKNRDTGVVKDSLRSAARAARAGDRLRVQGRCRGTTIIGRDLTIEGVQTKTSGPPVLDGRGKGSVLTLRPGVSVTLRNLKVRGGASEQGGGIHSAGTLVLRDVVVHHNRATDGGGVWSRMDASLSLRGSTAIRANTAEHDGGGVWSRGVLSMQDSSVITDNTATGGQGGGILVDAGTLSGVVCAPEAGANVYGNAPDQCHSEVAP